MGEVIGTGVPGTIGDVPDGPVFVTDTMRILEALTRIEAKQEALATELNVLHEHLLALAEQAARTPSGLTLGNAVQTILGKVEELHDEEFGPPDL